MTLTPKKIINGMLAAGILAGLLAGCGRVPRLACQGEPGSLVLDARGRTLFVAIESGPSVQAWDVRRRKKIAEVPVGAGPIRLAFDADRERLIALSAGAKRAQVFRAPDLKPLANLLLPDGPAAWAFEPERGVDLFAAPGVNAVRIYLDKNPLPAIETGAQPCDLLAQPGGDKFWVANFLGRDVVQISLNEGRVLKRVPVRANPLRLQLAPSGERLYVLCTGRDALPAESVVQEVDLSYGVGGLTHAAGRDALDLAVGALGRNYYCLTPAGLQAVELATGIERTFKTGRDPRALAVSPDESTVYVSCRRDQAVFMYRVPRPE